MAPVVCDFPAAAPGVIAWRYRNVPNLRVIAAVAVGEIDLCPVGTPRPEQSDREKRANQSQLPAERPRETRKSKPTVGAATERNVQIKANRDARHPLVSRAFRHGG
jgi:hypothetical protein